MRSGDEEPRGDTVEHEPPEPGDDPPPAVPTAPGRRRHPTSLTRTARMAWGAVILILAAVVALVAVALTGKPVVRSIVHRSPVPAAVQHQVTQVPPSTFDTVGVSVPGVALTPPAVLRGQPPLVASGKPEVVYVGAEFCTFCAAERWPLVVALSRFGTFSPLDSMESAKDAAYPSLQTFTFVGATYTSRYVALHAVEEYSDVPDASGGFTRITRPTQAVQALVQHYAPAARATTPASAVPATETLPFVDVGNRLVTTTSAFSPALLVHRSRESIAGALSDPSQPTTQAIVAAANQLAAGICAATGGRPGTVCGSAGVRAAARSLHLG